MKGFKKTFDEKLLDFEQLFEKIESFCGKFQEKFQKFMSKEISRKIS